MTVDRPDLSIDKLALGSFWVSKCVWRMWWLGRVSFDRMSVEYVVRFCHVCSVLMVNGESVLVSVLASLVVPVTVWCRVDV